MRRGLLAGVVLGLALAGLPGPGSRAFQGQARGEGAGAEGAVWEAHFEARILPTERIARAEIKLGRGADAVRSMRFRIDPDRHLDFSGDGEIELREGFVHWRPPETGGSLRYIFRIDHLRTASSYDARCADNWALFRGGDLFPPARVRMKAGARSRSTLRLRLPSGWSHVTPYRLLPGSSVIHRVDNPDRAFDRPTGWMLMGRIGVVREEIAGTRVTVAGPIGQGVRRHDVLAFLRWTLPSLREVFGGLPERVLLVGAGDPMWRGGLSGPDSSFLHAARPLVDHDGTSPVLHELVHVVMSARSGPGGDWITEGLAELYAVELLARSGTFSRERVEKVFSELADRGRGVSLEGRGASGDVTARAVTVLRALDAEIRRRSDGAASLDHVAARLAADGEAITPSRLRLAAEAAAGVDLADLFRRQTGAVPELPEPAGPAPGGRAEAG